jgi:hypothetical protein
VQSRWKHEKKCKEVNDKNKQLELKLQLAKEEKEILKLKIKLENSKKLDIISFKKLNKMLIQRSIRIQNLTINNNCNNNQTNIQNNLELIGFGKDEEILDVLSSKEKKQIINSKYIFFIKKKYFLIL